jgi:hypothetical protein
MTDEGLSFLSKGNSLGLRFWAMLKPIALLLLLTGAVSAADAGAGDTTVAVWKHNARGAFTMSFDDSMDTHARVAMPAIIQRGLVGTWFINPGLARHRKNAKVWEIDGPQNGQEYANHTWEHIGAKDYPEADFQIGACARYIWALRGPNASRLLAFASGGGTTWSISDLEKEEIKSRYHSITRSSELSARTDLGVEAEKLLNKARESIADARWVAIHFHGIGGEWLSIDSEGFIRLLDFLRNNKDKIWSAGWSAAYQYAKERDHARIDLLETSDAGMRIHLTTGLNLELYAEPLTLITQVPAGWSEVAVQQNGKSRTVPAKSGMLQYEAVPDRGEIELRPVR